MYFLAFRLWILWFLKQKISSYIKIFKHSLQMHRHQWSTRFRLSLKFKDYGFFKKCPKIIIKGWKRLNYKGYSVKGFSIIKKYRIFLIKSWPNYFFIKKILQNSICIHDKLISKNWPLCFTKRYDMLIAENDGKSWSSSIISSNLKFKQFCFARFNCEAKRTYKRWWINELKHTIKIDKSLLFKFGNVRTP